MNGMVNRLYSCTECYIQDCLSFNTWYSSDGKIYQQNGTIDPYISAKYCEGANTTNQGLCTACLKYSQLVEGNVARSLIQSPIRHSYYTVTGQ